MKKRHPDWPGLYADGSPDVFNGLTPNPSQINFLESPSKYLMWGGEVRAGKTVALCWRLFSLAWRWSNNLVVLGRWVKEHADISTIDTFKRCYPDTHYPITYEGGKQTTGCRFPNGSLIMFVPLADRKRWPGAELGAFGIDQAEQCEKRTWTDLMRRLARMNVPTGSHVGLGVANYEENWDWCRDMFVDKIGLGVAAASEFEFMTNPSGENDANIPPNYREENAAAMSPMEADRLMRGIDHRKIGKVYKKWDEAVHVKDFEFSDLGPCRFFLSYDYGRVHPTAILFGAMDGNGRLWVRAEQYESELDVPDHEMAVHRIALEIGFPLDKAFFPAGWDIFCKKHDGKSVASQWSNEFKWFEAKPRSVETQIEVVSKLLSEQPDGKPGLVVHSVCSNLRFEMPRYKYMEDGTGRPAKETPTYRADACASVAYMALGAMMPQVDAPVGSSILTAVAYEKMVRHYRRTGQRVGYWMPTPHEKDPGSVPRTNPRQSRGWIRRAY